MTLREQIALDSKSIFMNMDEFAEAVTYRYPDTTEKEINVIVVRQLIEPGDENAGRSLRKQAELYIAKEDIASIAVQNDKIILNDMNGISRTARIQEIMHSDAGLWHLLVGW